MSELPPGVGFATPLRLDDELREQLGLPTGEQLRLIRLAGRTVILERDSESGGAALPWDRDLVLTADVGSFPLADLLGMLHSARKSGFLMFVEGEVEKCVYFHRGEVVFASSNRTADRLSECLLRANMVTLSQVLEIESGYEPAKRFGKMLVERGYLTSQQLWQGVKLQVADIVRSLFAHTRGFVHFWEGDVEPDNVVRLSLPTQTLIAEGLAHRDELLRFLAVLESPRTQVVRSGEAIDLSANGRLIYDLLGEPTPFDDVCRSAGLDPLSAARTIQVLELLDAVEIRSVGEERGGSEAPDRAASEVSAVRAQVIEYLGVLEEMIAPLVALDGTARVHDRLRAIVDEMAADGTGSMAGLSLGESGLPDPEQLVERAMRLPGDRLQWLARTLGELLAYAEFDLRNHPGLREPERYLDALAERRNKLLG